MYNLIKTVVEQEDSVDRIDPWVIEEIAGWYKQSGVDEAGLSNMLAQGPETIKGEIRGIYAYLVSGRAFFGGQR